MNQHRVQIKNQAYDKSEIRTRQFPGRETIPLKYRSKSKPPVEPRMTKQQTRLSAVPINLNKSLSFMLGPSLSLLHYGVQLKWEEKLLAVIGYQLNMHTVA